MIFSSLILFLTMFEGERSQPYSESHTVSRHGNFTTERSIYYDQNHAQQKEPFLAVSLSYGGFKRPEENLVSTLNVGSMALRASLSPPENVVELNSEAVTTDSYFEAGSSQPFTFVGRFQDQSNKGCFDWVFFGFSQNREYIEIGLGNKTRPISVEQYQAAARDGEVSLVSKLTKTKPIAPDVEWTKAEEVRTENHGKALSIRKAFGQDSATPIAVEYTIFTAGNVPKFKWTITSSGRSIFETIETKINNTNWGCYLLDVDSDGIYEILDMHSFALRIDNPWKVRLVAKSTQQKIEDGLLRRIDVKIEDLEP